MVKYEQRWTISTPGLLIILLDQSDSMFLPYDGTESRIEVATKIVNRFIDNLVDINFNFDSDAPKNRCFISVIGYNHNFKDLCSCWLKDVESKSLRYESSKKKMPDGAGGIVEVDAQQPVWVEVAKTGGSSNMDGVFQLAKELTQKWISDNPQYPSPVIFNISDGVPRCCGKDLHKYMDETTRIAKEIMAMSNDVGDNVLLFNIHVDELRNYSIVFPNNRSELNQKKDLFLFDISSEVPDSVMKSLSGECAFPEKKSISMARGYINDSINLSETVRLMLSAIEGFRPIFGCE
jgi:hypothetical protein